MAKVLVTGGAGFIGSNLVDRLTCLHHEVIVIDNLSTGAEENVNKDVKYFRRWDVNDHKTLLTIRNYEFDFIFHLAAQINLRHSMRHPSHDAQNNIMGSLNVIEAATEIDAKLIFASTGGAIYSPKEKVPWSEKSLAEPESPYGVAKLAIEHYIRVLSPNSVCLRLANVYGPRQNPHGEAGVVAIFLENMLKGEDIKIFGDGLQTRDFVYVDDVVDAFILAMDKEVEGTYNVGTGDRVDIETVANLLKKMVPNGKDIEVVHVSEIEGELRHSALKCHDINAKHGWAPKTSFHDGLKKTVGHYL